MELQSNQSQIQFPIIDELADRFSLLALGVRRVIRALDIDQLREFKEFFEEKLKPKKGKPVTLPGPECVDELIKVISNQWNYLSFEITQAAVRYLENEDLMGKMKSYEQMVKQKVRKTLRECRKQKIKPETPPRCGRMSITLDVDSMCYSLHEILEVKAFLMDKLHFRKATFLGFQPGSIILYFFIWKDDVQIAKLQLPEYLEELREMKMVNVEVEGCLSFDVVTGKVSLYDCLCMSSCHIML